MTAAWSNQPDGWQHRRRPPGPGGHARAGLARQGAGAAGWARACLLAAVLAAALPAGAFNLVTQDEWGREQAQSELAEIRSLSHPAGPSIELLAPVLGKLVASPMDIHLVWQARDGAAVDTASLRIRYGRLGIDVTARVLGAAKVGPRGIEVKGAQLPGGEHRLVVEIADNLGRVAQQSFVVTVQP
jgi:hypothetical protein